MRYVSTFLLALALLAGCSSETNPLGTDDLTAAGKATSTVLRTTINLNLLIPAAASSCLEEDVLLAGPVAVRVHTTIDGRGVMHQNAYFNWKDVVATGQTSGTTWTTTAAAELYSTLNQASSIGPPFLPDPNGSPAVFHHTGAIRFHSDSDAPNLYVRHLVQHVVDAKGNLRVDTDLLEVLECR